MKDLYTFDESEAKAVETYSEICNAYDRIFQRIGVPYIKGKINFTEQRNYYTGNLNTVYNY